MNGPWPGAPRARTEQEPASGDRRPRAGWIYGLPAGTILGALAWLAFGRQPGDAALAGMGLLILSILGLGVLIFLVVGAGVVVLCAGVIRVAESAIRGTRPGDGQTHETFMMEEWRHNRGESNPRVVVRDHGPTSI